MGMNVRFIPDPGVLKKLESRYSDFRPYHVEAIQALFFLSADLEKALNHHFEARAGFSRARFLILMVLMHTEDHRLPPHEIAKRLNVTRGNMTGLVDGLIGDGLVEKTSDSEDGRLVWISVTRKGQQVLENILPDYFKRLSRFMAVLNREEVETFTRLARKFHAGLDAFLDEGT